MNKQDNNRLRRARLNLGLVIILTIFSGIAHAVIQGMYGIELWRFNIGGVFIAIYVLADYLNQRFASEETDLLFSSTNGLLLLYVLLAFATYTANLFRYGNIDSPLSKAIIGIISLLLVLCGISCVFWINSKVS